MGVENKLNYTKQQNLCLRLARQERERERVKRIKIAPADHV